jgi:histidine triad (HIT) family protein
MKKICCILLLFSVLFTSLGCRGNSSTNNRSVLPYTIPTHNIHGHKSGCIFCNMSIVKQNPVYFENDSMIIFKDQNPEPKVHILCIPKVHIENLADVNPGDGQLLGQMLVKIAEIGKGNEKCPNGFRVVANSGRGANQTVFHLHFHILGGQDIDVFPELGFIFDTNKPLYKDSDMIAYMCTSSKYKPHIIIKLVKSTPSLASVGNADAPIWGRVLLKISEYGHDYFNDNFRVIINSGAHAHQENSSEIYIHIIGTEGDPIPEYAFCPYI